MSDICAKVLVIDDSQTAITMVTKYLGQLGLPVATARNATEGMAVLRSFQPDLVLCDVVMPERDGYDFLAELRADPKFASTPVVLMSGVSAMQDRMRAVDAGADDLLTKPFDRAELISRVKALLRLKAREDALRRANDQLSERVFLMSTLFVVGSQLRDTLGPADIYRVIRETLMSIIGAQAFSIYIRDAESARLLLVAQRGLADGDTCPEALDLESLPAPVAAAAASGKPFTVDLTAGPPPEIAGHAMLAVIPILAELSPAASPIVVGLVNIHAFLSDRGQHPDMELVTLLSSQVAGAIHALRLQLKVQSYASQLEQTTQELARTHKSLDQQLSHLHTLMVVSAQLHSVASLAELVAAIRDLLVNLVGVARYHLVYCHSGEQLVLSDSAGPGQPAPVEGVDWQTVEQVMTSGRPAADAGNGLVAAVPLLLSDRPQGVLLVESLLPHKPSLTGEDHEFLSLLAHETAVALGSTCAREQQAARRRDFYAMLAHDFRGPIGNLQMALKMLSEESHGAAGDLQREFLALCVDSNRRLAGLLDDFLAYSQIEAGELRLDPAPCDLTAMIHDLAADLALALRAKRQTLELCLPPEPVRLLADAHHLRRVLANLLDNAIKYGDAGVQIQLCVERDEAEVRVHVRDNGPGISPDELPALFNRYRRAYEARGRVPGTGLGLLIVKEIVEGHVGQVWAESAGIPGQGSTFSIALPRVSVPGDLALQAVASSGIVSS